ncbi:hypothetical protein MLD38_012004 [Melastoma candidum]|uniref:Uncharacterized protein n=1 Tax=Melastoma candidum TaxID=119954 RepID=A0ACB9R4I1_9MYRT|nr:hypothetical protein MLD38_012004 [Melastoma candidum]
MNAFSPLVVITRADLDEPTSHCLPLSMPNTPESSPSRPPPHPLTSKFKPNHDGDTIDRVRRMWKVGPLLLSFRPAGTRITRFLGPIICSKKLSHFKLIATIPFINQLPRTTILQALPSK